MYFRDGVLEAYTGLQASDSSTWKTEARGFVWIWGKQETCHKTLFIKKKKKTTAKTSESAFSSQLLLFSSSPSPSNQPIFLYH